MSKTPNDGTAPRKRPSASQKSSKPKRKSAAPKNRRQQDKPIGDGQQMRDGQQKDTRSRSGENKAKRPDNRRASFKARKQLQDSGERPRGKNRGKGGQAKKFQRPSGLEGIAAREAAVFLLHTVMTEHHSLDGILARADKMPELSRLSKADRGFARAIAATALRRRGQLLDVLKHFMEKGIPERAGPLREILISAAAQLLFLDSPPHAVINIAVQQVKRNHNSRRYDKLTNAVLRRVMEKGPGLIKAQDGGRLNTPNWLWNSWCRTYDKQTAKYIAEAHLHQARLDLSVSENPQEWAEKTGGILLPTGSIRVKHKGRIENIKGFDDGAWWVQDAAAALPARLLGDIKGKQVADLAAAPGGKTAQMIAMGAKVTAVDWSVGRLKRLAENLERLEMDAHIINADILEWQPEEKFDAVLLDAPCTATGTIRRHPDLPYLKAKKDLEELTKIQAALLDHAIHFVKPGGTLIYCTCSLQDEEGAQQIKTLLKRNKKVRSDKIRPEELSGRDDWITPEGFLRTLPFHRPFEKADPGMDGFFAARLIIE